MKSFEECLKECPLVAILRGITPGEVEDVCDVLYESGVRLLEITLNTSDALECIDIAIRHAGDRMRIGAGTVLTPDDVVRVHGHGGSFIISPNTDVSVIRKTRELGMISMPGFFSPSEAFTAMAAGATYLKLFPAGSLGASYVKDLKAVIKTPIFAVGGVNKDNLASFMKVCIGAGIGSFFYKPGKTLAEIRAGADEMIAVLRAGK